MAEEDAAAVGEEQDLLAGDVAVGQPAEDARHEVLEAFLDGAADFAQQQALEAGLALAVVHGDLGEHPVGFAAAASAAVGDLAGAVVVVGGAGGGRGDELARLEDDEGFEHARDEVRRAAGPLGVTHVVLE